MRYDKHMATKISLALATYNEEKNISRCLESVQGLVDEIILVDGTSNDKTVEIARQYQAETILTDNKPMFHFNKQAAIDAATGVWVLQLDADEAISDELKEEIRQIIDSSDSFDGYWMPRKNYFLGKFLLKGGQYPDYTLRLYRRGKGRLPCKSVHEQAVVDGTVGYLKHDLLHYPFPDFKEYLNKANRYANLLAQDYFDKKIKGGFLGIIKYMIIIPKITFFSLYFRHLGILDGLPGFVFALYSSIQKITAYILYTEAIRVKRNK